MSKYVPPHLRGKSSADKAPGRSSNDKPDRGDNRWTERNQFKDSYNSFGSRNSRRTFQSEPLRNNSFWGKTTTESSRNGMKSAGFSLETSHSSLKNQEIKVGDENKEEGTEAKTFHVSEEQTKIAEYFRNNSVVFKSWEDVRAEGHNNNHIARFFEKKNANRGVQHKRAGAHVGADIGRIFQQFYNYAVDIDNGCAYSERAIDIATEKGSCWFLDFGFAPGGMSDLLLSSHPGIKGVGVSLDPAEGGNVYLESLKSSDRFTPLIGDVIEMARRDIDVAMEANLPKDFDGFDFAIIGITIHQEWEGENINELKDLLHFSQLYISLKYLKPGGMVLMRMHMSTKLIDCHFLSLMLSMFDIEKFSGVSCGRQRLHAKENSRQELSPAEDIEDEENSSSLDRLVKRLELKKKKGEADVRKVYSDRSPWWNLKSTAVATKPFSTFSMRKTYWILYHGFNCEEEKKKAVLERLKKVIAPGVFAYQYKEEESKFSLPIIMPLPLDELLETYGARMIKVLETVWGKQVIALKGFMAGKTDKRCRSGMYCRRRRQRGCNMAHDDDEMISEVLQALHAVNIRAGPRLKELLIS